MAELILTPVNSEVSFADGQVILNYRIDEFADPAVSFISFEVYFSDEILIAPSDINIPGTVGTVPPIGGRIAGEDIGNADGDGATTQFIQITLSPLITATSDTQFASISFSTTATFDGSSSLNFLVRSGNVTVETPQPPSVTILDATLPTVTLTLSEATVQEAGGTTILTATLSEAASQPVTLTYSFSGAILGTDFTVTDDSVVIPAGQTTGTVTLTGLDNAIDDGDRTVEVAIATLTNATPSTPQPLTLTLLDDDTAGITVTPESGLITTEAGGTATFTVVLNSQPTGNVTLSLTSSDSGEGTVAPGSLTFTPGNFDRPQTVTVTGIDDSIPDGDIAYTIQTQAATSSDPNYDGLNPPNVRVTNQDQGDNIGTGDPLTDVDGDQQVSSADIFLATQFLLGQDNPNLPFILEEVFSAFDAETQGAPNSNGDVLQDVLDQQFEGRIFDVDGNGQITGVDLFFMDQYLLNLANPNLGGLLETTFQTFSSETQGAPNNTGSELQSTLELLVLG